MSRSCSPSAGSTSPTRTSAVGCSNSGRRSLGACDGAVLDRAIAGISTKCSSGSRGKHMYLWRAVDREGKVLEEENGLEIDQSSLERRRPFSRGDQRFESPLLHRRITLSSHFSITGTTWAAPAPRVNRELLAPRRSRRRRLERTVDLFDRAALGFAAEDHRNRSLPTASR